MPYLTDGRILEGKRAALLREGRAVDGKGTIAGEMELGTIIVQVNEVAPVEIAARCALPLMDAVWKAGNVFSVQQAVVVAGNDDFVHVGKRFEPVQLGLELFEGAFVCEIAGVEEYIPIRQRWLRFMRV